MLWKIQNDYGKSTFSIPNPSNLQTQVGHKNLHLLQASWFNVYVLSGQHSRTLPEPTRATLWVSETLEEFCAQLLSRLTLQPCGP